MTQNLVKIGEKIGNFSEDTRYNFSILLQHHIFSHDRSNWSSPSSSSTDHVRNEVLLRVSEQRNILHEIRKRKANWTGYILT